MGTLKGSSRRDPWNQKPVARHRFKDDGPSVDVWSVGTAYQTSSVAEACEQIRERADEQGSRRRANDLSPKARDNARLWRRDVGPEGIALNLRLARAASGRAKSEGLAAFRRPADLPGLLDQQRAAEERVWYVSKVRGAGVAAYRAAKVRGVHLTRYAVTVVPPRWMVPVKRFRPREAARNVVEKWRPQAQRWMRNLPPGSFAAGMIEVAWNRDEKHDLTDWCFHLHLLVYLPCSSQQEAREAVKEAFTCRANERLGVPRPRSAKAILHTKGGPRGWLRYCSKGLQLHAIQARRVPYDLATRRRGSAAKWQISDVEQLSPIAELYSHLQPNDLMVWSGVQRRGDALVNARSKA